MLRKEAFLVQYCIPMEFIYLVKATTETYLRRKKGGRSRNVAYSV